MLKHFREYRENKLTISAVALFMAYTLGKHERLLCKIKITPRLRGNSRENTRLSIPYYTLLLAE